MTDVEQKAVANGWRIEDFRAACAHLRDTRPAVAVAPVATSDDPPRPIDLAARFRAEAARDLRERDPRRAREQEALRAALGGPRPLAEDPAPVRTAASDDMSAPPPIDLAARFAAEGGRR